MLGVWSTFSGDDAKHLEEVIIEKACTWVGRLNNCPLAHHLAWMAYQHQLWSGLRFSLGTLATPTSTMQSVLQSLKFEMLSLLGVNQHVKIEWCTIAQEFGGIRLHSLSIEWIISWAELILQHYGAKLAVSAKIKASLQAVQLEVGCRGNPFDEDFGAIVVLATECRIKSIWERMWLYNFQLYLDYPMMAFPRVGNKTIVDLLLGHGI